MQSVSERFFRDDFAGTPATIFAKNEPKALGLVWIYSSSPIVVHGLAEILKGEALIHHGQEPPANGTSPTYILFCSDGVENSVSWVRNLRGLYPGVPIVVISSERNARLVRDIVRAGARGFLHFGMLPTQIIRALSVISEGKLAIPREIVNELILGEDLPSPYIADLTLRQQEVLKLVGEGLKNAQIARRLFLSESTVKQHLRAAYKTLGVSNRTEAAKLVRNDEYGDKISHPSLARPGS